VIPADLDEGVEVIRHHYEGTSLKMRTHRDRAPPLLDANLPFLRKLEVSIDNVAKDRSPAFDNQGQEIPA
jgi:hypothetical protein